MLNVTDELKHFCAYFSNKKKTEGEHLFMHARKQLQKVLLIGASELEWATLLRDCVDGISVCMYVCMYVCTVVIPYYFYSKLHETFIKCKLAPTHRHTIQCHIHCYKLFQHIQLISVAFEPVEEMLFINSKSQCNVCTHAVPKLFFNHLLIVHVLCTYSVDAANVNCLQVSWNTVHPSTATIQSKVSQTA